MSELNAIYKYHTMKQILAQVLVFLCVMLCTIVTSSAKSIFENCIWGWEFGGSTSRIIDITPLGNSCQSLCADECKIYSSLKNGVLEYNKDVIEECTADCQSGEHSTYSSRYKVQNTPVVPGTMNDFVYQPTIATKKSCTSDQWDDGSAGYYYYNTGIDIDGKKHMVSVTIPQLTPASARSIYMCGFASKNIYPSFYSLDDSLWQQNTSLWTNPDNENPTLWNARADGWFYSGIYIKNGDYLSITYGGPYYSYCPNPGECYGDPADERLDVALATSRSSIGSFVRTIEGDALDEIDPTKPTEIESVLKQNGAIQLFGDKMVGFAYEVPADGMEMPENVEKYKVVTIGGEVSDVTDSPNPLFIKYAEAKDSYPANRLGGKYVKIEWKGCPHSDGELLQYAVIAESTNLICSTSDASQRTEASIYGLKTFSDWKDVPALTVGTPVQLQIAESGRLFFRIKDDPSKPTISASNSDMYLRSNTFGVYRIQLIVDKGVGDLQFVVDDIIKKISGFLFGDTEKGTQGVAQKMFNELLKDSKFVDTIRALITLYITITGLLFMIGASPITQKEVTTRLIKMGLVLILISDQGWDFFNTYIFDFFRKGSLELMTIFYKDTGATPFTKESIEAGDLYAIFRDLNRPISDMLFGAIGTGIGGTGLFGGPTYAKIVGLVLSSSFGIFMGLAIVVGAIFYALAVFKVIMMYLTSLFGMAMMIMTAPIFISFILFSKTAKMFDSWLKLFLSFALQPVMAFAVLGIMSKVLYVLFRTVLGFTVCEICLLRINIPGVYNECFIPAYNTLRDMFDGSGYLSSVVSSISVVVAFLVLAFGCYTMVGTISNLATQLVTGGYVGVSLAQVGASANPMTVAMEALEIVTGSAAGQKGSSPMDRAVAKQRAAIVKKIKGK